MPHLVCSMYFNHHDIGYNAIAIHCGIVLDPHTAITGPFNKTSLMSSNKSLVFVPLPSNSLIGIALALAFFTTPSCKKLILT